MLHLHHLIPTNVHVQVVLICVVVRVMMVVVYFSGVMMMVYHLLSLRW